MLVASLSLKLLPNFLVPLSFAYSSRCSTNIAANLRLVPTRHDQRGWACLFTQLLSSHSHCNSHSGNPILHISLISKIRLKNQPSYDYVTSAPRVQEYLLIVLSTRPS
ncbi:hypothetical protein DFH09DRAFT_1179118, partial [Mycena vulgaris]